MSSLALPAIIPLPAACQVLPGRHALQQSTSICAAPELLAVARRLQSILQRATGWPFALAADAAVAQPDSSAIQFELAADVTHAEGYRLAVDAAHIRIQASQPAGAFYGLQTFLQLLPPAIHQGVQRGADWSVPCLQIEDEPRFPWRGALLDSSRHFHPVAFIKKFLDLLTLHKLNVFQWHFIDDQGWRLEIKKYPRLTAVGSRRSESPSGTGPGDGQPHQGFYTQEQVREIVAYAAERFITIVPEVEMPGHAQAAIAAYPELGCEDEPIAVSTKWGVHECIFNADESTLTFLQDVLEEVVGLFPGTFIHVGGDEAAKGQWERSASVQARQRELGLKDAAALQSYFISRMADFLAERGRRLVCWDEILEGGVPAGAVVMAWRGVEFGATAANAGHDVVVAPIQGVYLDYCQGPDESCEPMSGGHLPLETVYAFDPVVAGIAPENAGRVKGTQAQLWTEWMRTTSEVEYMAFPRLCAVAEVAWSPAARRDFADFRRRLLSFLKRLDILDVRYRKVDELPNS